MLNAKKLLLLAAVLLGTAATADARPRLIHRQRCVSPAPVPTTQAPRYDTIPRPVVPVPAIPPGVLVMPQTGVLNLPNAPVRSLVQTVGGCLNGMCPVR